MREAGGSAVGLQAVKSLEGVHFGLDDWAESEQIQVLVGCSDAALVGCCLFVEG